MLKFKNYGLWISLFSVLGMALIDFKVIGELGRYEMYVQVILSILVALGVVSNPKEGKGYIDK